MLPNRHNYWSVWFPLCWNMKLSNKNCLMQITNRFSQNLVLLFMSRRKENYPIVTSVCSTTLYIRCWQTTACASNLAVPHPYLFLYGPQTKKSLLNCSIKIKRRTMFQDMWKLYIIQISVSINWMLLEHSLLIYLRTVYGCFFATTELSNCSSDHMALCSEFNKISQKLMAAQSLRMWSYVETGSQ